MLSLDFQQTVQNQNIVSMRYTVFVAVAHNE